MPLLDIRVLGDPILREETIPVADVTDELRRLIDDMFETMRAADGIGLAAPQVGRRERLTVIEIDGQRFVLINPEILHREGSTKGEEGCLSIPEVYADVERAERVVVRAVDRDGKSYEVTASALLARCLQHEIDHLHGRLFIDHLSVLKRRAALARWTKEKGNYPGLLRKVTVDDRGRHDKKNEKL